MKRFLLVLAVVVVLVVVPVASAQWADPGGTWSPASPAVAVAVGVADAPAAVAGLAAIDVPELVLDAPPSVRPVTPPNPYEGLPPGAVPPSRPAVPVNPYVGLPPGVTVARPAVPCSRYRPDHCAPGEVPT